MRSADLADTPLASYRPDTAEEVDSLADRLRELIADFIPAPLRKSLFGKVDALLESHAPADPHEHQSQERGFEHLRRRFSDTRLTPEERLDAAATAIAAGDPLFTESYQFYADHFAITRACIHEKARKFQRSTGLRARRDKSDEAREGCAKRASGSKRGRVPTAGVLRKRRALICFAP